METTIGEPEVQMIIKIQGQEYEVVTTEQAAKELGYCQEYVCRLCDEGKMLSHKVAGVWWIQIWQFAFMSKP